MCHKQVFWHLCPHDRASLPQPGAPLGSQDETIPFSCNCKRRFFVPRVDICPQCFENWTKLGRHEEYGKKMYKAFRTLIKNGDPWVRSPRMVKWVEEELKQVAHERERSAIEVQEARVLLGSLTKKVLAGPTKYDEAKFLVVADKMRDVKEYVLDRWIREFNEGHYGRMITTDYPPDAYELSGKALTFYHNTY